MADQVLVTGANGQLGSEIRAIAASYPKYDFIFTDSQELDISNKDSIQKFIDQHTIKAIINCAAYTAVDKAESERELAAKINHFAVEYLAEIAAAHDIQLIHISTDYVFDGKNHKPYETDAPIAPVNYYGESKSEGERAMMAQNLKNSLIIRTSWVYSSFGNNFVKTMIRLGQERDSLNVISDQVGVPTYARDLATFILKHGLSYKNSGTTIYHFTNEGVCSWYDFAIEIMKCKGVDCTVSPIPSSAYPTPAKRPFYSLMDKSKTRADFQTDIPHWRDSLVKCIQIINKEQ